MDLFEQQREEFVHRHIGPDAAEMKAMLDTMGLNSLDELIDRTVPAGIRLKELPGTPAQQEGMSEHQYLQEIKKIAAHNKVFKNYIGLGYYDTITPSVILRNVFENPGWYTQYTPYQAEISQGRLECLLNFQTVVSDLTGLPVANASLLDEATAAAEAMHLLFALKNKGAEVPSHPKFFADEKIFPQTKEVLLTRAEPMGIELVFGNYEQWDPADDFFGALLQYPDSDGAVEDYRNFINNAHTKDIPVIMATDLLALTLLTSPGELGADIAIGSAQRLGVPLGFGGPHAAFFAVKDDYKRIIPGRIIGISEDAQGNKALRMALQTREQHIRREKATSNICTAQALLANMAALYAVYHGPDGLKNIAKRISLLTNALSKTLVEKGYVQENEFYFDTIKIKTNQEAHIKSYAEKAHLNFRYFGNGYISISIDETTTLDDIDLIIAVFSQSHEIHTADKFLKTEVLDNIPSSLVRTSDFMTHPVFHSYHSETKMMRYLKHLENKDIALDTSMIPLGSCTMKLNAASELIPVSRPEFSRMHPFAPEDQTLGYSMMIDELSDMLCTITGFAACSLQPNSGAQGEFTGLMVIRAYHHDHGNSHRNVVLIPISAHGTNPASAVMAGMKVVIVKCDDRGNIDIADLKSKAEANKENLAALMVTYPSTYGVFEESIKEICQIVHDNGGLVYLDGANMNAQVGYTSPGFIGADVCHLNLHKTFAIPHGGGGPGVGPICVNDKLAPYLPGNIFQPADQKNEKAIHAVSAALYGSASILLISYGYTKMLGIKGMKKVTGYAILNANYMKSRLEKYYPVLYSGKNNTCAHEFIVDLRPFKKSGIEAEDVAKRLMDYGFHAPTLSFPVPGTLMIEPTESEDKGELDRFCDAMIAIKEEITDIENGEADATDNVLKNAPHTQAEITADDWKHVYSRQQAAFPLPYLVHHKFWPAVARVNNTLGDRHLICTCEPVEAYVEER
jgi:glycine dehydrogenase